MVTTTLITPSGLDAYLLMQILWVQVLCIVTILNRLLLELCSCVTTDKIS